MSTAPPRFHLVPGDDAMPWHLTREGTDEVVAMLPNKKMGLVRGMDLAETHGTELVVHADNGQFKAVLDGENLSDLEVVLHHQRWHVRKCETGSSLGEWEDRNTALQRALELARARGARVILRRPDAADLVWRNAAPATEVMAPLHGEHSQPHARDTSPDADVSPQGPPAPDGPSHQTATLPPKGADPSSAHGA